MKKILFAILLMFGLAGDASAGTAEFYFEYLINSEVNYLKLNGNIRNILTVLNGGLDNINSAGNFNFVEIVSALPLAGEEGRVVYLTTDDTLNFDDGTQWLTAPTVVGSGVQGDIIYFDGSNWVRLAIGTSGKFLQSTGSIVAWEKVDLADTADITGILATGNGGTGTTSGTGGNAGGDLTGTYPNPTIAANKIPKVIFAWSGNESYAANTYGMNVSTTQNLNVTTTDSAGYVNFVNDSTTYRTFLNFKFKKTAGVDTITIHARIWSVDAQAIHEAFLNVDIGGASNTVKSVTSLAPSWVTTADINVSGLTDGNIYNGVVQLKAESDSHEAYCSAVTLIGS